MATKDEPRKHHLIPSFYLAGFTASGTRDGTLHVFDHTRRKRYKTTPLKASRETDFYKIDVPGVDPNEIETALARHETVVAPFVQKIATGGRADHRREVGEALALAASIMVRSRWARTIVQQRVATDLVMRLRQNGITQAEWDRLREAMLNAGNTERDAPDYATAVYRARSGYWMPPVPPTAHAEAIPLLQPEIMKILHDRDWELHATHSTDQGGFICSDAPLTWGDPRERLKGRLAPLTDPNVEVSFPLSRSVALVSYPGAYNGNKATTDQIIAHVNTRPLFLSTGLIFHASDSFLLEQEHGQIRTSDELFAHVDAGDIGLLLP
jgi:hypothetical protein